jgi:exopolyphosphatase/guanosine-5'-triphosphate,3'-diphosphate pyrophosphatase
VTDEETDRESPPERRAGDDDPSSRPGLVAVLDMGASAIRLVVAEIGSKSSIRIIEEASRGVLLGRDTFSSGAIRSKTIDASIAALDNFRHIIDGYGACRVRAVATSAVREARNVDTFLDRIQPAI